ncbi:heparan-alpha-glucosaminide N-acetyltransferase [Orussus abietinus]|uniref:heparan-alpha-glucosaminide N-acetyltransferase n=1 Tax=Orussus abietinus TaxID=222816 RepID=UPI000625F644|nr:heparan-alpha-glucosaminide N-acetyltransferase [Orussus abietinus]
MSVAGVLLTWLNIKNASCGNDTDKPLGIDEACFSVVNTNDHAVELYSIVSECYVCNGIPQANLSANSNTSLIIPTRYPMHVYYVDKTEYCHTTFSFVQYGHYGWNITDRSCSSIYTLAEPVNPYLPILMTLIVLATCAILGTLARVLTVKCRALLQRKFLRETENSQNDREWLQPANLAEPLVMVSKTKNRMHVIDAFRGITILLMVFVNNGGGSYRIFQHSPWNGLTIADLVLPWFAWIMGLTLSMSLHTQFRVTVPRTKIILKTVRRMMILILLGLVINSIKTPPIKHLRFPGILQLLAISYCICVILEVLFAQTQRNYHFGRLMFLQDILNNWIQWLIILTIVAIHTLITFLLPVPNCPTGYLGPGGYHLYGKYANCTGGAAGYIDRFIFGNHIYNNTHNPVYGPVLPHDPEGMMNTMSAILFVYFGVQAYKIVISHPQNKAMLFRWLLWSFTLGIIAGILSNFSKEEGVIPVNKNMMSLSFVLATSSLAFFIYAILWFVIMHRQFWTGAPFIYAGANSIFIYVGHYLTMDLFPWYWEVNSVPTHSSVLAMNLWSTTLWGIIAYGLYKKNIIITV